jgi:3-oxoacyl-[acyl-carrier-protein] synthase-3
VALQGPTFGIDVIREELGELIPLSDAVIADYTLDNRRIGRSGYSGFHRAAGNVGLTDLAVRAAEEALTAADITAVDVDLIVLAITDIADYLYWDAAAAIQGRLGATRAEAVLMNQACSSGVLAFDCVAGKFATHSNYRSALIVSANRVCEAYWNRMSANTCLTSDGAVAAVIHRDFPRCRWLATEVLTDGRYADLFRLSAGGERAPFGQHRETGSVTWVNPLDRFGEFFENDAQQMLAFSEAIHENLRLVMARACERVSISIEEVRRVIHLNDNLEILTEVARTLGVERKQTNTDIGLQHGHFGTADQLWSLGRYLVAGDLQAGDVVALTSMGNGMHWAVTLLQV